MPLQFRATIVGDMQRYTKATISALVEISKRLVGAVDRRPGCRFSDHPSATLNAISISLLPEFLLARESLLLLSQQGRDLLPASDPRSWRSLMLGWAITFLLVAIIAAVLGFGGIAGAASSIAQILFVVFLVLFVVSLIAGRRGNTVV